MIKQSVVLKNQRISECKKCKGQARPNCRCVKKSNLMVELAYANIPIEYWFLSLKGLKCSTIVKDKIKRYCSKIKNAKKYGLGLCLFGQYGRGKTFLSTHILKKAVLAGYSIYLTNLAELLNDIKMSFNLEGEELKNHHIEMDKYYIESDFLVMDNLNQEYKRIGSDFTAVMLDEFLRKRNSNKKVTILTTNSDPNKLKGSYGSAVFSILQGCTKLIKVTGKDNRKDKSEELWKKI